MPVILPYKGVKPVIDPSAFIAPNATIVGDVYIGPECGIWYGCVIRGDVSHIRIGARSNVQDGTVIHCTETPNTPTIIGENVTIGHQAMLHACTLEDRSFIGMSTTILDKAVVESGGMLAAGAMLTSGKHILKGELWAGNPAKFFRPMTEAETAFIAISADNYVRFSRE
ncbi:MAG: gamma carbonic anhydrase family protein, partial [Leptospiraceae bacterium]|nr:gamma carbonic anhydrase family protein [Leptospiraceae bacterium]